ncbi:hypothetical protein [Haloarcula rubripromontorii]|uniref:hypothetical protein n=1 Tax=Haloarcula rubripromontorii TaxID=1705562 RepID=UPI00345B5EA1
MARINVEVDDDTKTLFDACADDSEHGSKKAYFLALLHEDAEERGISVDDALSIARDDEDEQPPLHARYDPDEYDDVLDSEQLREIVTSDPDAEINPDHVGSRKAATPQGYRTEVVEAMARYEFGRVSTDDVKSLCRSVGLDTDYYLRSRNGDKNIPGKVTRRLGGDGDWNESVATGSDDETVDLAVNAALLRVDGGESDYKSIREDFGRVKDETDVLSEDAASVVSTALYAAVDEMNPVTSAEDLRDEWPDNPLALSDWVDEATLSGLDDEVDRGVAAKEIADVLGEDVLDTLFSDTTAGVWTNGTQGYIENEDLAVAVLESRLRDGEEALEANPDHPNTAPVEDVLDDLREEIEARKTDGEDDE